MISRSGGTQLVGILNLTPNSFSDGGMFNDFEKAKEHLLELINDELILSTLVQNLPNRTRKRFLQKTN